MVHVYQLGRVPYTCTSGMVRTYAYVYVPWYHWYVYVLEYHHDGPYQPTMVRSMVRVNVYTPVLPWYHFGTIPVWKRLINYSIGTAIEY
jgi:hypothetical protein